MNAQRISPARLLAGLSFIALAGHTAPALAANECGVTLTGAVTCTSAGNPYAGGITYIAPIDVAVTTNADVVAQGTVSATSIAGMSTVTSNGSIATNAEATDGIDAVAPGNITVTATSVKTSGADSAGINAQSSGGGIAITSAAVAVGANGGAGILALAPGAITITSGNASALNNSAIFARSTGSSVALTLTGASTSTTADAAVTAIAGSNITVNVAAGASVSGINGLVLSPQPGFTSTITNAGTLTGTSGNAIFAKFGTTTVVNTGTINSAIQFTGAGSSLNNSGTFNVTRYSIFGTGAGGTLTNSGLVQVAAAAPTTINFTSLASFANSGTVSLANGHGGDVLSATGTFTGSGASTLVIDAGGGAPDKLVIGGAATGVTTVQIVSGNAGGLLSPGAVVVAAGAGTSPTAFQLAPASATAGFVQYALAYNAAANSFSLVATPGTAAYRTLDYAEGARNIWYKTSEVWEAHMLSLREGKASSRLWGQFYGSVDTRQDALSTTVFGQTATQSVGYRQDDFGAQLGLDLARADQGAVTFGVTGGYVSSNLHYLGQAAQTKYNVVNGGAYAGFHAGGLFVNLLGNYSHYWIHADDVALGFSQKLHGNAYGATGEAGFHLGDAKLFFEPVATLSYVRTELDSFAALSSTFDFGKTNGFRGKLGGRFGTSSDFAGGTLTFYGGGNAVKAFRGRDQVVFTNNGIGVTLRDDKIGLYGEGYGGISITSPNGVSGFMEGFGDYGSRDTQRGGGGRAGLRIGF